MLPRLHTFPRCPLMWIQVQRNLFGPSTLPSSFLPSPVTSWSQCLLVRPRLSFRPCPSSHLVILPLHTRRWGQALLSRSLARFPSTAFPHRASGCCGEAPGEQHLSCSSLLLPFLPNSKYQRAEEGEALSDLSVAKVTFLSAARQFDGLHCRKAFDAFSSVFCNAVCKELI